MRRLSRIDPEALCVSRETRPRIAEFETNIQNNKEFIPNSANARARVKGIGRALLTNQVVSLQCFYCCVLESAESVSSAGVRRMSLAGWFPSRE